MLYMFNFVSFKRNDHSLEEDTNDNNYIDNNPCGLQNFDSPSQWNFGTWDIWARTISPNPNVKIYIGAPASASAAGGGYVPANTLANIVTTTRNSFPSFGGVMFWGNNYI